MNRNKFCISIKKIFVLVVVCCFMLIACNLNKNQNNSSKDSSFDWLVGNWERTNNSKDKQTFERWTKVVKDQYNTEYHGLGFTLAGKDTVFKEELRLFPFDHSWVYEVIGVNPEPTNFPLSEVTDSSFVCNNSLNDFPKQIAYNLQDTILVATISGVDNKIDFVFRKIK